MGAAPVLAQLNPNQSGGLPGGVEGVGGQGGPELLPDPRKGLETALESLLAAVWGLGGALGALRGFRGNESGLNGGSGSLYLFEY